MKKENIIRGFVLAVMIGIIVYFYPKYDILTNFTVKVVVLLSSLYLGIVPAYYENNIFYNFHGSTTTLTISPECTGLFVILMFLSVVWVVPNVSLKNRIYAFIFAPIIYLSNIIRLLIAVIIGDKMNTDALVLFHGTAGQLFIFLVLIGCFVVFINSNKKDMPSANS